MLPWYISNVYIGIVGMQEIVKPKALELPMMMNNYRCTRCIYLQHLERVCMVVHDHFRCTYYYCVYTTHQYIGIVETKEVLIANLK